MADNETPKDVPPRKKGGRKPVEGLEDLKILFAERLNRALRKKGWDTNELDKNTGYGVTNINNWRKGTGHMPDLPKIIRFAALFKTSVDWLVGESEIETKTAQPETVMVEKQKLLEYGRLQYEVIYNATATLWMQFRVGTDLKKLQDGLIDFKDKDGLEEIRLLLPSPQYHEAMALLAQSRAEKDDRNEKKTIEDINTAAGKIKDIANGISKKLEIKYMTYLPSSIAYLVDADTEQGKILTVPSSFQRDYWDAPMTIIDKKKHRLIFEFYRNEFQLMWDSAKYEPPTNWE